MDRKTLKYIDNQIIRIHDKLDALQKQVDDIQHYRLAEMERDIEYRLGSDIQRLERDIDSLRRGY